MRLVDQINNNDNGHTNRVLDSLQLYAEQEAQFKIFHPVGGHDLHAAELKLQHYTNIYNTYRKNSSRNERKYLHFVHNEIAKLKARLNPTLFNRVLYSRIVNKLYNFLAGKAKLCEFLNKSLADIEHNVIREHNLGSITDNLKKTGFTFQIEGTLRKMMDHGFPKFHLPYADVQNKNSYFILHFNKLPGTSQYYFEKFECVARPSLDSLLNRDSSCRRHTFSQINSQSFSASEADRLVNGKCVCKVIDKKETWLIMNSISAPDTQEFIIVPFDLEKSLAELPVTIKNGTSQYNALLQSLKNGKSKEVMLIINNIPLKYTLEAAPLRKTIDVLDRNGNLMDISKLLSGKTNQVARQIIENHSLQKEEIDMGQARSVKVR